MTFACIGAVDAMHNTLDWAARSTDEDERIGIVIFSDNAKYALESAGEYTQGAGGGAILIEETLDYWKFQILLGYQRRRFTTFSNLRESICQIDYH